MNPPIDKNGKEIKVGDGVVYVSPDGTRTSHVATVVRIADGALFGQKLGSRGAYSSLSAADVIDGAQLDRLSKTYEEPSTSLQVMNEEPLRAAKDYIKYSQSSGAPSAGRRRKTKKSKRRSRKTRRSRK